MPLPLGIDLVIPAYNEAAVLPSLYANLAAQVDGEGRPLPRGSWRLVLVDNASTDGTAEVAERLARDPAHPETAVLLEPEKGVVPARIRGSGFVLRPAERRRFPVVIHADADNLFPPAFLHDAARRLAAGDVDVVTRLGYHPVDFWRRVPQVTRRHREEIGTIHFDGETLRRAGDLRRGGPLHPPHPRRLRARAPPVRPGDDQGRLRPRRRLPAGDLAGRHRDAGRGAESPLPPRPLRRAARLGLRAAHRPQPPPPPRRAPEALGRPFLHGRHERRAGPISPQTPGPPSTASLPTSNSGSCAATSSSASSSTPASPAPTAWPPIAATSATPTKTSAKLSKGFTRAVAPAAISMSGRSRRRCWTGGDPGGVVAE